MATDPYAAPRARVADQPGGGGDGSFVEEGQAVAAGNGWQWIADAWGHFKQQPGIWIAIVVILLVVFALLGMIPLVGPLANALLGPVFAGGIMLGCDAQRQGGELEIGHLFAGFKQNAGKLVLIGVFNLVAWLIIGVVIALVAGAGVMAGMMGGDSTGVRTAAGLGAIALAGLIALALSVPVYMAIWFAAPLVALNDLDSIVALKTSFSVCLKNIVPFLLYGVVMFALAIVASIPLGLGWLALGPVLAASVYTAYRDVFYTA
ncbi:MAG TPA: BPSS1780 family membrane protein [Dongiaceae bacterium]|nr:BPSS1780 family membrane protein [Dongiaceae bacterium]